MLTAADLGGQIATATLLIFGLAGVVGSLLFGRYFDRQPILFVKLALFGILGSLFSFALLSSQAWSWLMIVLIWGIASTAAGLSLQIRLLKHASRHTDVAMSIFSGIFNVGIGGGALIRGLTIQYLGLGHIGYVAASVVLAAVLIFYAVGKRHL